MSKSFTKALCLLVTLAMLLSYAVLPVYADTTASVSQPASEPTASDTAVAGDSPVEENPAGTSETAQQLPVIPNEPIAQAPAGGENEVLFSVPLVPKGSVAGNEPLTGSAKTAKLDVIINYPNGKSALKTGDIVTLLFKIVNFADNDALNGTTTVNSKTVEKGIGAYKLSLVYNNNFVLDGAPVSKFTTATTPYALFDQSNNAATSTVNMVAVFSTFRNNKVEALNEAALLAVDGLLATVKLKFTGTSLDESLSADISYEFDFVGDNGVIDTAIPLGQSGEVKVDSVSPVITVTDQYSDFAANRKAVPLKSVLAPGDSVDPNAQIIITDTHEITKFSVQKGSAPYKAEDTDGDANEVKFVLPEPGTYKITATDAVGNISVGMVLVKPRVTGIKLAITGNTYQRETFTVTPTLVPALNTPNLPSGDTPLVWMVTWRDGTMDDDFFTVNDQDPTGLAGYNLVTAPDGSFVLKWTQNTPAPVKIMSKTFKSFSIYAETAAKQYDGSPRASSSLYIKSPVKVLDITMTADGNKKNLSSVAKPKDSVKLRGYIKTQQPITLGDSVSGMDFNLSGIPVSVDTSNTNVISPANFGFTKMDKALNTYYYEMVIEANDGSKGICDAILSCGDKTAAVAFNITNYLTTLTTMTINQKLKGLDYTANSTDSFTVSISDAGKKTVLPVGSSDCNFYTSNSSLLSVAPVDGTTAGVTVLDGAKYITAPTNVIVTAELKNDPQKRKTTAVYTIYPTERHTGVSIDGMTCSGNIAPGASGPDYHFTLGTSSIPTEAQLNVMLHGPTLPSGGEIITPANKGLVQFSSSNNSVATVSDIGVISVRGYGECFITVATRDGSNGYDRIKVVSHKSIDRMISANPPTTTLMAKPTAQTVKFGFTGVTPADATNKALITKAKWETKYCLDTHGDAIENKYFTINSSGLLTVAANTPAGTQITVIGTVEDKAINTSTGQAESSDAVKNFLVQIQSANTDQLALFTGLIANPPILIVGDSTCVKVNSAFNDYLNVQWSLGAETPTVALEYGLNPENNALVIKTMKSTTPGKRTLFASYMGKTLSIPVVVRDQATKYGATMKLNIASPEYRLYDAASSGKLELTSTYYDTSAKKTITFTVPGQSCIISSSMPNLVKIDINGDFYIDETQAYSLSGNVPVDLTATVKGDPEGRKASKRITVTPKLLTKQIALFGIYNERNYSLKDKNNICEISLDDMKDPGFSLMVTETLRNDNTSTVMPSTAKSHFSGKPVFDESLKNALYGALTFSSTNPAVATVDANGLVAIKNAGTTTLKIAVANGLIGPTEPAVALESVTLKVTQKYTAINLDNHTITLTKPSSNVTRQLKATTTPANGKVNWEVVGSSMTVTQSGLVTISKDCVPGHSAVIKATVPGTSLLDECKILIGETGKSIQSAVTLTEAQKNLTLGTSTFLPFRSNANSINDITVTSSNPAVFTVSKLEAKNLYDKTSTTFKGYQVTVTPTGTGTASVIIAVSGSVYTQAYRVYAFNPAGNRLVVGSSLTTQMLDSSNESSTSPEQVINSSLVDKNNVKLAQFNISNNEQYLTFTSSNPNILAVEPDGTFYTRNLDTIKNPVNVDIKVVIKGEPSRREGKITFKVTPAVSASRVIIKSRESGATYLVNVASSASPELAKGGKAIYTDIGDPAAQRVFNLGAQLEKTNNTAIQLADSSLVTWASSNNSVATVDQSGTVTVRGKGTALITATAKDGSFVKDTVVMRVNNRPRVLNDIPRKADGTPQTVSILAGGSYTIPYKLNTGLVGDYYISEYKLLNVPTDGDVTVDQKTGKLTAKAGLGDISGITAIIHFKTNKLYVYDSSSRDERFRDGSDYTDNSYGTSSDAGANITVNVPIQVAAKASVKAITLYEAQNNAPTNKQLSTFSAVNLYQSATYQFYIQQTALNGQVSPGTGAVISIERLNNTTLTQPGNCLTASLNPATGCFMLTANTPGSYRLNVTLGGKTVSYTVNVYLPWFKNAKETDLQPLTSAVRLTGMIVMPDQKDKPLSKLCREDIKPLDIKPLIRIVPASGSCWSESIADYGGNLCTYTSSSPLLKVDASGFITLAAYIPAETTVTITATLINDPAGHKVSIPIKITGQHLTRSVSISMGNIEKTGQIITGYLANNSSLRLSANCTTDGTAPADNRNVVWSSNKPSVVRVDNTGKVTFVGAGTATVTAKAADGGGAYSMVDFEVAKNCTVPMLT